VSIEAPAAEVQTVNRGLWPTYNVVRVVVELPEADARALVDEATARADLYAATARGVADPVAAAIQAALDSGAIEIP
tara:strand:- start:1201 stop:1431 length:231 start_codon:yes stop_codon:yes gene_type:complete